MERIIQLGSRVYLKNAIAGEPGCVVGFDRRGYALVEWWECLNLAAPLRMIQTPWSWTAPSRCASSGWTSSAPPRKIVLNQPVLPILPRATNPPNRCTPAVPPQPTTPLAKKAGRELSASGTLWKIHALFACHYSMRGVG